MKNKSIKLLLWAIFTLLLSICMRVLFIGYETPNIVIWISFVLPIVSVLLAAYSWLIDSISDDQ